MKKQYMKPSIEAVEIRMGQQLLAGSLPSATGGNGGLDEHIGGGDGTGPSVGRAPLFEGEEWDILLGE